MKKFFRSLIIIAAAAALVSFQVGDTPQEVAVNFTKAILVLNFDSARMYVASNSLDMFSQTEELTKNLKDSAFLPDSLKQILARTTVTSTGETKINDSTANVDISETLPQSIMGQQESKITLVLVKENGAWKVDLLATAHNIGMSSNEQSPPTGGHYPSGYYGDPMPAPK